MCNLFLDTYFWTNFNPGCSSYLLYYFCLPLGFFSQIYVILSGYDSQKNVIDKECVLEGGGGYKNGLGYAYLEVGEGGDTRMDLGMHT